MSDSLKALLLFVSGAAAAMTTSALVREAPGAKTYYARKLEVSQTPVTDGGAGNDITAFVYANVSLALADGGTSVADLGGVACPLSGPATTQLQNILNAAANCAANAP